MCITSAHAREWAQSLKCNVDLFECNFNLFVSIRDNKNKAKDKMKMLLSLKNESFKIERIREEYFYETTLC